MEDELLRLKRDMEGDLFQAPYQAAVRKAEMIIKQEAECMSREYGREIISRISGRLKCAESVQRKLKKKGYPCSVESAMLRLNDLAGVRVTCYSVDDVYELAARLKQSKELQILKEKDYIDKPKASGYKSLHLIAEVCVQIPGGEKRVRVEIQLRTLAMDCWARLDHKFCYKKEKFSLPKAGISLPLGFFKNFTCL